jgi:IS4 transposase
MRIKAVAHHNTVFHQILSNIPWGEFGQLVEQHGADKGVRRLTSKTQLTALLFHQFSETTGLRRLVDGFNSHRRRLHHLGCEELSRSTLSDANATRPHAVFSGLFAALLARAHGKLVSKARECVHLIDSTTVRLTQLSGKWARFSEGVYGAKAHIVYDPDADCPIHAVVTPENVNDISAAKVMPIKAGATYVFDLGYYDYGWWADLDAAGCRMVTRFKANTPLREIGERLVEPGGPILSDRTGLLPARQARSRSNPMNGRVREVRVRTESGKILRLFTNDLTSSPEIIADLYKRRWAIELFFRWVKQTLKIRHFLGTSENAVRIQITVALIAFLLLRVTRAAIDATIAPLEFATLVKVNLMHRRTIRDLFDLPEEIPRCGNETQGVLQWA